MSKKAFSDTLRTFNEKYHSQRLPVTVVEGFGSDLGKYIKSVNKAVAAGENEETIKNLTNRFLIDISMPTQSSK